jgi:hypothetical protein
MIRVRQLSGLGASSSESLINLLDSIPLVDRAQATKVVRALEAAVADAAEARVEARVIPRVESTVKKGVIISVGLSAAIGLFVLRRAG